MTPRSRRIVSIPARCAAAFALAAPLAGAHGGHGVDGEAPEALRRLLHLLREPEHAVPVLLAAAVLATLVVQVRRRSAGRRR